MAKWLAKANDLVLSHCTCVKPIAGASAQLDCPWCGCGWMIPCSDCGKSFIFAEIVEIDQTYEALAEREFRTRGLEVEAAAVAGAAEWMRWAVSDLSLGATVVHLDCRYFTVDACDLAFTGEFATHSFERLPHALALENPSVLRAALGESRYWFDRERPDRNEDE